MSRIELNQQIAFRPETPEEIQMKDRAVERWPEIMSELKQFRQNLIDAEKRRTLPNRGTHRIPLRRT